MLYLPCSRSGDVERGDIDVGVVQHLQHFGDNSWAILIAECEDVVALGLRRGEREGRGERGVRGEREKGEERIVSREWSKR